MDAKTCATWGLCALAGAAATAGATIDRTYQESYDVAPGAVLEVHHGDGDVDVRPWAEDRVDVVVRYHARTYGVGGPRDFEVDFETRGDVIRVVGREIGSSVTFGGMRTYEHSYTVQAPPWVALRLRGDDGNAVVRGWEAVVDIEGNDGDARLDGLRGDLELRLDDGDAELSDCVVGRAVVRLEDGDLRVERGAGDWSVALDDGDVDIRDLAASRLHVEAQDGDLDIALATVDLYDVVLRTDDGNVILGFPAGAAPGFSITVDDGTVRLDLEGATVESRDEHVTRGRLGPGGGGSVRIVTQDGDVTLRDAP